MNTFDVTRSWQKEPGKWRDVSQAVVAVNADAAVSSTRYGWLAILSANGCPDPERAFEEDFRLKIVKQR